LVLAPPALVAAWFGGWVFAVFVVVAGVLMAWEWNRLCLGAFGPAGWLLAAMALIVGALGTAAPFGTGLVIGLTALAAPFCQRTAGRSPWWMLAGALYIGVPEMSLLWIRDHGRDVLLWLLLLVWATDVGAYAAGRTFGGPRLFPRISPKKTWAGLAGGMVSAALIGLAVAGAGGRPSLFLAGLSAALAVLAQGGDLAESWVKRYFGVKDSSGLIPGHGGVLDRLDGLLAAAPVVAVICLAKPERFSEW
jgi:phosphatidate cytidylyltransferase